MADRISLMKPSGVGSAYVRRDDGEIDVFVIPDDGSEYSYFTCGIEDGDLVACFDDLLDEIVRLRAELERARPVVKAALAYAHDWGNAIGYQGIGLLTATDAYNRSNEGDK